MRLMIVDAHWIANAHWGQNDEPLSEFDIADIHAEIIPRQTVLQCDTFIVTTDKEFKILKTRVDGVPNHATLQMNYLSGVIDLVEEWYQ